MPLPLLPLISLATTVVPQLVGLFAGKRAAEVADKVADVVTVITGERDPEKAQKAIDANPEVEAKLRAELEKIRVEYLKLQLEDAASAREHETERHKIEQVDRSSARDTMIAATREKESWPGHIIALAPVLLSAAVILIFFVFAFKLVSSEPGDNNNNQLLNVIVGALVAGFTAVVNFWLGSSQGSRDKDRITGAIQAQQAQMQRVQVEAQSLQAIDVARQVRELSRETVAGRFVPTAEATPAGLGILNLAPGQPSRFDLCIEQILTHEGGFVNHPRDPGGATNMGITLRTLRAWRDEDVTEDDVRNLSRDEAKDIYRSQYWNVMKCDDLPQGVDLMVFDFGVNAGPRASIRILQRAAGAEADGSIGPLTLRAVRTAESRALIDALARMRIDFYRKLETFQTFGGGWEKRVEEIRKQALLMVQR